MGYIFVIESFGDRRGSILRKENEDSFSGYSPVKLRLELDHLIKYLGKENDDDTLADIPLFYKNKFNDTDFDHDSVLDQHFSPDCEDYFHIPFEKIDLLLNKPIKSKKHKSKPFGLDYDPSLGVDTSLLDKIQLDARNAGFDPDSIVEDDRAYKFNNPPSFSEEDHTHINDENLPNL